jgi:hypothetical protein
MPSRRQLLRSCAALGLTTTLPVASAARGEPTPEADLDAALDAFGAGRVSGRAGPAALTRLDDALDAVAAESPETAADAAERVPSVPIERPATDGLGPLETADIHVTTDAPVAAAVADPAVREAVAGVDALSIAVDFTARGPVVRARVVGAEGAPSRRAVTTVLSAVGFPGEALADGFAVPDGDAVTVTRGFERRRSGQPFVLLLFLVLLAAVLGTFVLGIGGSSGQRPTAPQVNFEFEATTDGGVTVTHQGGDNVESGRLTVRYTANGASRTEEWTEPDGDIAAGDRYTTQARPDPDTPVRVVWTAEDGSTSVTLGAFEMP